MTKTLTSLTASIVLAACAVLLAPGPASALSAKSTACTDLIVLGARGSGTPMSEGSVYGFGNVLSPAAKNMVSRVKRSGTYRFAALPYDASPVGPAYVGSVNGGAKLGASILTTLTKNCPKSKFALLGHSQGAQVWRLTMPKLSSTTRSRVVLVGLVGDPTRRGFGVTPSEVGYHETFNTGSFSNSGVLGAGTPYTTWLPGAGSKVATFCSKGDGICNKGLLNTYWHSTFNTQKASTVGYGLYTRLSANGFR